VSSVNETITVRFGRRLQALRKKRGWTQVEMAERLGIDRSYISDMERGKKNVCLPTLEIMAQGLGTTISRLLRGL
jgi:transcriptional regulator with XRE-family HTH domain